MLLDAWAHYYDGARKAGKGEVIEDDGFDLNQILSDLADPHDEPTEPPEVFSWHADD